MLNDARTRRTFLGSLGGLGALAVAGKASGGWTRGDRAPARRSGSAATQDCTPGHTDGDPACTQIRHDGNALTPFDGLDTDLVTTFSYPCGWNTSTSEDDDRIQANATRSDIGEAGAYVDVQIRNYHDPVEEGFLDSKREEGDYEDIDYEYAGHARTGLVSSAETAEYGTLAHAVVPDESGALIHVELVSTMHGADCLSPRPDYDVVRDMLVSIEPNRVQPSVTINDQQVSGEVETQAVTVDSATLPDGGFVVVHVAPIQDGDRAASIVGASSFLGTGTHEHVRIALEERITGSATVVAAIHRDTDGDNVYEFDGSDGTPDGPYEQGGEPVTDRATVSAVMDTPVDGTATRSPTEDPRSPTGKLGAPATGTPSPTPDPRTSAAGDEVTEGDGPGFGVLGALAGVVSAFGFHRLRNDRE